MRVHLEEAFPRAGFNVWFYEDAGRQIQVYRYKGDEVWESELVDEGSLRGQPSLFLPRSMLEELIRASEGHVHAEDATVRHLDDATSTRDRLLSLIEKGGLR